MSLLNDRYRIVKTLGAGGAAEVYLAEDTVSADRVAIKRISVGAGVDAEAVNKEINALIKLDHPGVVKFIEVFEESGAFHLVTEFVEGQTLEELFQGKQISPPVLKPYALQILTALDYIHARGIIHSDLKPANIIIDTTESIRLIDFGIVRSASAEIAADIKQIRGTLHYMSPEQAEGSPYDIRSDLFSFGVILYEALTDRRPFEGDYDMAVMYAILYEEAVPPEKINSQISAKLSDAILVLLSKNASDRPASASQVLAMLDGAFEPAPPSNENEKHRIAIMPFDFPPEDSDSRLIAEGLRDELHARLQQMDGLDVVSPIRVMQHSRELTSGNAIRSILGADDYLTGSIRRIAARIRIYLILLSSADDSVQWSEKYDSPLSDLFDVIDTITEKVMAGFKTQLTGQIKEAEILSSTTRPEAYELYLLAKGYYVKNTRKDLEYARNMYLEALKLDPNYALAQVGVADCFCMEYMNYFDRSEKIMAQASEWAEKALTTVPNLPEAFRTLGRIIQATGRPTEAAEYYLKAVTYKEDYYLAYRSLGWLAKDNFRYEEALEWVRKSLSINSTDLETVFLKGIIHFEHKESKQAINDFTRCLELRPDYGRACFFMGMSYFQLGRLDDAIASMERAINFGGDINAPYLLGFYNLAKGEIDKALHILQDAASRPEIAFLAEYYRGLGFILKKETETAKAFFEKSTELCRKLLYEDPSFAVARSVLAKNLAFLNMDYECRNELAELRKYTTFDGSIAQDMAKAYAILGDKDKAEEYIARALETQQGPTLPEISHDPILKLYLKGLPHG